MTVLLIKIGALLVCLLLFVLGAMSRRGDDL
jgi:hypothetical protein